jgi:hypothetical protein
MNPLVVFLDIDGVLRVDGPQDKRELDSAAVSRFQWFAKASGAKVVISSSWRHASPLAFFQKRIGDFVVGMTPYLPPERTGIREREIKAWVSRNAPNSEWIAIDDDPDLFFPSCPWLFLCNSQCGFDLPAFNRLLSFNPLSSNH